MVWAVMNMLLFILIFIIIFLKNIHLSKIKLGSFEGTLLKREELLGHVLGICFAEMPMWGPWYSDLMAVG